MSRTTGEAGADPVQAAQEVYEKAAEQLGRANIAVVGSSGVGKSTLINAMFGFDIAKTGVGRRVTEETSIPPARSASSTREASRWARRRPS
jgi:putative ribosome biogenesis GTPase RsgA